MPRHPPGVARGTPNRGLPYLASATRRGRLCHDATADRPGREFGGGFPLRPARRPVPCGRFHRVPSNVSERDSSEPFNPSVPPEAATPPRALVGSRSMGMRHMNRRRRRRRIADDAADLFPDATRRTRQGRSDLLPSPRSVHVVRRPTPPISRMPRDFDRCRPARPYADGSCLSSAAEPLRSLPFRLGGASGGGVHPTSERAAVR